MKRSTIGLVIACSLVSLGTILGAEVPDTLKPEAIEARIRQHRMGELIVKTRPGAEVRIEQLRHQFWFGTAMSNSMVAGSSRRGMRAGNREKYLEVLAENFNAAVHENALKWHQCEPKADGGFTYSAAEAIYEWCAAHEIPMRGHCMFWAVDRNVQDWVRQLDGEALRAVVKRRATGVTSRFKGRIEEFDLNNEMIFGNFYRRKLGHGIIKEIAEWAKAGNGDAVLYLNEQGSLASGGRDVDRYVALIEEVLGQGVPIGGIGCQGHFRQMVQPEKIQNTLDRLGRFGLPIKITEYDYDNPDEQLKEEHLREFYTICFAHPAVEGILMWGFWEGAHWRARAALWKRDWSETPAVKAYRDLVFDKWWTKAHGKADSDGVYRVRAFYGKYSVESEGKEQVVTLQKEKERERVVFAF